MMNTDVEFYEGLIEDLRKENEDLRKENSKLKQDAHRDWFISLEFYIMANRVILDHADHYQQDRCGYHVDNMLSYMNMLSNTLHDSDTQTKRLCLKLIEQCKQCIQKIEEYA